MSFSSDDSARILGPASGKSAPYAAQSLADTTAEDHNATALIVGRMATLKNGPTAINFTLRSSAGQANQVAITDTYLAAGDRFDWLVEEDTKFVYAQSHDSATQYYATVWVSS